MPAISVIVPVYNVEPYIARCVRSLFGQTLRDIEFLFIDDCSPDRSMDILREVMEEFPERKKKVTIYRMPQNSGQAKVRMQGLSMATGQYVIHCDSDDTVDTHAYEKMYRVAQSGDFDIVTCDFNIYRDNTRKEVSTNCKYGRVVSDIITGRVMGSLWFRLIKRELFANLIPPAGNMAEDTVLVVQVTCKAKRFAHINQPLYNYFIRSESISQSAGMDAALNRWKSLSANVRIIVNYLTGNHYYTNNDTDIVYAKYRSRYYLHPFVHIPDVYQKWRNTFPEIDNIFLLTKGIPFAEKFWYVLIRLKLYHPWKNLTNKLLRQ